MLLLPEWTIQKANEAFVLSESLSFDRIASSQYMSSRGC